jgi:hypothetical protein
MTPPATPDIDRSTGRLPVFRTGPLILRDVDLLEEASAFKNAIEPTGNSCTRAVELANGKSARTAV